MSVSNDSVKLSVCLAVHNESKIIGECLKDLPVEFFDYPAASPSVYHLFVVRTPRRAALQEFLSGKGISTGVHYPIPLPLQKAFDFLGYRAGQFPVSEKLSRETLSLPIFPEITGVEIQRVADAMRAFFTK